MPHQDDHGGGGGWQHYRPSSLVSSPAMAVTQPQPDFLPNSDDLLYTAAIPSDDIIVAEPPNGVTLLFRGVSVATKYNAVVETVCRQQSSVHVRQATGFFMRGHVHGIVALNESSAVALADALSGRRDTCEGQIWADGVPVLAQVFRESVGVVKLLSWAFPEFSVESNLSFAGRMRREGVDLSHRVELLCKLFHLPPSVKVLDLTPSYRRRLDAAMELMASPPILVVHNPLHGLDTHSVTELVAALDHAAEALGTTVVLTLPSLELSVYDRLESLVILGDDGHTVYSGRRADMASYFVHRVMHPLHRHATRNNNSDVPPNDSLPLLRGTDEETRASALVARHTLSLAVRRVSTLDGASGGGGAVETECGSVQESAPDLDGGEGAMDYVHLWAAAKVTDRYAAAFFDSAHRSALDTRIDTALAESRAFSNSVWMRHPLQPPNALKKFCMLAFANIRQRVVTLDFYVGWFALSVWITGCVLLEHYQETTQQGLFNTRGILFFMIAITLQLNQTFLPAYSHDVDRFLHLRESGVVPTPVQLAVIVMVMCLQRLVYLLPVAVGTAIALNKDASVTISLLGVISWAHITLVFLAVLIFRDRRISTIVIALYDAYQLFFSGFLVNTATQPESGFASGSLARYVYGSCVHHYLVTTNYTCDGNDWTSYCYTSQGYLELEGFQNDDTHHAVAVMAWVGGLATFTAFVRMWLM